VWGAESPELGIIGSDIGKSHGLPRQGVSILYEAPRGVTKDLWVLHIQ